MNFRELSERALKFREERRWGKYHTPKNLAISLAVELGELLEHFQWKTNGEIVEAVKDPGKREAIADEMADVVIYLALLAHELGIDLDGAVERKLRKNEKKYPVNTVLVEEIAKELGGGIIYVGKEVKSVSQVERLLGVKPSHVIKSLLFIADDGPLLVIVDGESRASLKKLEKLFGNVRMAKPAEVKAITGYAVGGVPPVGVPVRTVVDRRVLERDVVIGGGGRIDRLIRIKPGKIVEFQKAEVLDIAE
ncbi:hypothetical protein JCM16138_20380 [Thermococcus atlanticus]